MPCYSHTLSAARIPVQPEQLPNALFAPSGVAFQYDSVIVTNVRVLADGAPGRSTARP
jgi:hypothetical protein